MIIRTIAASVVLAIAAFAAQAGEREDRVTQAYAAWDAAFGKADAKAVAAFYAKDAVFLPPTHAVVDGPAGVQTFFQGLFDAGVTGHKLVLLRAEGQGDLIVAAARWSAQTKDGDTVGGVATHAFEKEGDSSWKLVLHTFN